MYTTMYTKVKLRWSLFLLVLVATFVVFANTPPATISESVVRQQPGIPPTPSTPPETDPPPISPGVQDQQHAQMAAATYTPARPETGTPASDKITKNEDATLYNVRRGDTISSILKRHNVFKAMPRLIADVGHKSRLFNLTPDDSIELVIDNGRLLSLKRAPDKTSYIIAMLRDNRYIVNEEIIPTTIRQAFATGTVSDSFYAAGLAAGMSDKQIINAANILGWDIDFVLDVRKGDSFVVVYNEEWLNGEKIKDLEITDIEYVNRGKPYRATRYTTSDGKTAYYTPEGKNVKRPFIRTPLDFTRISSRFNPRRLHPILKVHRPHRGVDYAAPTGTPVYSAGDGKISFRGVKGGYGNVVIVRHGHRYSTLYAHLSRFARGLRVGSRVRQKQVIGYVGSTGYSTGPHLHYEFRVNGVHKNPLSVKLPGAKPLPSKEIKRFLAQSQSAWDRLDSLGKHLVVSE